jgi:hypothetical protein
VLEPAGTKGTHGTAREEPETLSRIIAELNERLGLNLGPEHRVTLGQMMEKLHEDAGLDAAARVNTRENVRLTFDQKVEHVVQEIAGIERDRLQSEDKSVRASTSGPGSPGSQEKRDRKGRRRPSDDSMQRTALRAAADAGRQAHGLGSLPEQRNKVQVSWSTAATARSLPETASRSRRRDPRPPPSRRRPPSRCRA